VVKSQQGQAREADVHPALDLEVFRQMADMSNDGFYLCDEHGRFLYVNDSSTSSIGYTRDELLTMCVSDIAPDFPPDRLREFVANLRHGPIAPFETVNRHKNGTLVPIEISVAHLEIEGADYMFGVVRDISERKQLETSRKSFTQRMLRTLEAERQRIARELHDDVGQSVATVGVLLHALEQTPGSVAEEVRPALAQTHASIRQITESVARIVRDYHPAELLGLGLEDTLRSHVVQFTQRHHLALELATTSTAGLLDHEQELHLYRIAQEALTNIARHAHARRVVVRLKRQHGELVLTVRDDGIGFTPETSRASGGLGLVTMQERAELMHATLTLESTARHGTEVRIAIPVDAVRAARPTAVLVSATPVVETPDGETTAADRRLTVLERPRR
jgi:PAS domain S-box-containing protein